MTSKAQSTAKRHTDVAVITKYQALDGSEHDTYAAARTHNRETEFVRWLDDFMANHRFNGDLDFKPEELAEAIRADWLIAKRTCK